MESVVFFFVTILNLSKGNPSHARISLRSDVALLRPMKVSSPYLSGYLDVHDSSICICLDLKRFHTGTQRTRRLSFSFTQPLVCPPQQLCPPVSENEGCLDECSLGNAPLTPSLALQKRE